MTHALRVLIIIAEQIVTSCIVVVEKFGKMVSTSVGSTTCYKDIKSLDP